MNRKVRLPFKILQIVTFIFIIVFIVTGVSKSMPITICLLICGLGVFLLGEEVYVLLIRLNRLENNIDKINEEIEELKG